MVVKTASEQQSGVPKYARIYSSLCARIKSGELKVGHRLESEREIANQFHVSLMTVRQALDMLEREGLVDRKHGSGTFARAPSINWNRLMSFTEQMAAYGLRASTRVLSSSIVKADAASAERLQISTGALLVSVERLRSAESESVALETCFLPLEQFPGLLNYPLDRCSLFQTLAEHYRVSVSHTEESIVARLADKRIARLLGVPVRSPLLYVDQLLFARGSRPIAISLGWYRADRHQFKVIRTRAGTPASM